MRFSYQRLVPMAIGVVAMAMLAQRDGWDLLLPIALVMAVVLVVVLLLMSSSSSGRHQAVAAAHPGAEVIEVWGAAGLRDALRAHGVVDPKVRKSQGTALSMVIDQTGIGLWRGRAAPEPVVELPWAQVVGVFPGEGVVANHGPQPALVLVTRVGASLTLCPAAKTTGSLRTAGGGVVLELVERLNRMISNENTVPGSDNRLGT